MVNQGVVKGHIHQGILGMHGLSTSFGTQCTIIAFIAIVFAGFHSDPQQWLPHDLDTIVFEGDSLYQHIVQEEFGGNAQMHLNHEDVPERITAFSRHYRQNRGSSLFGAVNHEPPVSEAGAFSLSAALDVGFAQSDWLLATFGGTTVSLFHRHGRYYVFDSHARNTIGHVDPNGSCVLLMYENLSDIIVYFHGMYANQVFNLTPFQVVLESESDGTNDLMHSDQLEKASDSSDSCFNVEDKINFTVQNNPAIKDCVEDSLNVQSEAQDSVNFPNVCISPFREHSYSGGKGQSWKKRKGSRAPEQNLKLNIDISDKNLESSICPDSFSSSVFPFGVGSFCTVVTESNSSCDSGSFRAHMLGTVFEYEQFIQCRPNKWCLCCDRFLFDSQVHHISGNTNNPLTTQLSFDSSTNLCKTCCESLRQSKMPSLCSKLNFLEVDCVPNVLSCLSRLEKKLLALIQICMTMVVLPGGQYAEKGLVVDLPQNVSTLLGQLHGLENVCTVRFEYGTPIGSNSGYLIDPIKVKSAAAWLKKYNPLYSVTNFSVPNIDTCTPHLGHDFDERASMQTCVESLEEVAFAPVNYTVPTVNEEAISGMRQAETVVIPSNPNAPVCVYEIPYGEEKAFPWLFPYGQFGYTFSRPKNVKPSMYFRYRLYNHNAYWRKDITYLLHAAVSYDKLCLKQQIGICMKILKPSGHDCAVRQTTAEDVRARSSNDENTLNSYMFMKNIRGTVAYFRNALYDLFAMFRCLGPPTLFMTLSADDLHWPELGMSLEDLSFDEAINCQSFYTSMRSDPLLTAVHFDRRFTALMRFVIHGEQKPLGNVNDYFARVEFQNRGSPHYHMFFWVENVPNGVSNDTRAYLLRYIDKTVHTRIPGDDDPHLKRLVLKLQTHSHTSYCMPSSRPPCRFGFPKKQCSRTCILTHFHATKNKGQFYQTYRPADSCNINAYNPSILLHWRANMDIQIINDANGAAYYVCHYLCKSEPDELKLALANLINTVFKQNPNLTSFQRLWNIGICVLKNRRVSAQEAAFRLSALKLLQSSRTVVYLNTRPVENRYRMLRPISEINELENDDTNVFVHNLIDYYCSRPDNMEMMSLLYFASWYTKCPASISIRQKSERVYIQRYDVWVKRRTKFAVVRFPTFSVSSDAYYFALLMLLLPFRIESDLLSGYDCAKDAFVAKHALLDHSMGMHNSFLQQVEASMRRIQLAEAELNHESQDDCDVDIDFTPCDVQRYFDPHQYSSNTIDTESTHYHQLSACSMNVSTFETSLQTLTTCQKRAINIVQHHFSHNIQEPLRLFITGGAGVGKSFLYEKAGWYLLDSG